MRRRRRGDRRAEDETELEAVAVPNTRPRPPLQAATDVEAAAAVATPVAGRPTHTSLGPVAPDPGDLPASRTPCRTGSTASAADMEADAIAAAGAKCSAALPGVRISPSTPLVALGEVRLDKGVVPLPRLRREAVVVDTPRIPGNHVEGVEREVLSNAVLSHVRHGVLQRRHRGLVVDLLFSLLQELRRSVLPNKMLFSP